MIEKSFYLVYLNEVVAPKLHFSPVWSCSDLEIWPLDLKFSEILNTAPISLFDWKEFLFGIFEWSCGWKLYFYLYLVMLWPWNLPLDLKVLEILNTAPITFFDWKKSLPGTLKWIYGSKMAILPIFRHVVTLTFRPQIFRNS